MAAGLCAGCTNDEHRATQDGTGSPPSRISNARQSVDDGTGATSTIHFADFTKQTGIEFTYQDGQEAGLWTMPEAVGGGIGWVDFDCDGHCDLFVPGGGRFPGPSQISGRSPGLFRNIQRLRFTDVTAPANVATAPWYSHGVTAGDFNQDGFSDLLVTGFGGLLLFQNQGDGTFTEVARQVGLTDESWSVSAAWGDVDGDTHPDLYVVHYVNWSFENNPYCPSSIPGQRDLCSPKDFDSLPDTLYLGNGDGTFRDGTGEAGLRPDGKGLAVLMADLDLNGSVDVYVANDQTSNFLYRNNGQLPLREVGLSAGVSLGEYGDPDGSMGIDLSDYDLDGQPDLGVANYEQESFALYRNLGSGLFRHSSRFSGMMSVPSVYVGWGTIFFDADLDGDEDLFVSNGHVIRFPTQSTVRQLPLLFENRDGTQFVNVAPEAGDFFQAPRLGRGASAADFDDDGDLDIAVCSINEPVAILANETEPVGSWVGLRLIGTHSSRWPVGATVFLDAHEGRQFRQLTSGGFAGTDDVRLFFAVATDEPIDAIEVRWPSGAVQTITDLATERCWTVVESTADQRAAFRQPR